MSVVIFLLAGTGMVVSLERPSVGFPLILVSGLYLLEFIQARKVTLHASDARAVLDADGGDLSQELIAKLQRMAGDHAR